MTQQKIGGLQNVASMYGEQLGRLTNGIGEVEDSNDPVDLGGLYDNEYNESDWSDEMLSVVESEALSTSRSRRSSRHSSRPLIQQS